MKLRVIDLFAGLGGWSTGAEMAGHSVVWAANHWPEAVKWHAENHPATLHACQDLHQADWSAVPDHDVMLASPCCQGHSRARGKGAGNPQHDASRSTAWAVVAAAEVHRPPLVIVENVPEFAEWSLFPAWREAMASLGYSCAPHVLDCADLGVPQNRVRLFLVCTRSSSPLNLRIPRRNAPPADQIVDWGHRRWSDIHRRGRAEATLNRIANGRSVHGDRFVFSYYGNTKTGRSIARPFGTITTRDRWGIVDGARMRMMTADEALAAMSFPPDIRRPANHRLTMHLAGNAVPPLAGKQVLESAIAAL